ncbi:hypothetical protein RSOLAG1IB_05357 [Rhizoctonia solani AG-1 IB]|uniref:RBR-type E3 ubiquitin transferase n=1 Tax=Thanatephorus cucumeris (strain AG1-IB / isolate 7/3/14) TaxID=1108050 RepID=A0A0B7G484_THACB|nr:hypothetical protein RSOLAG1IB_05357 [Rhizoctonia solani AG-1 IB]
MIMSWYFSSPTEAGQGVGDEYCTISLNPFKSSPATERILTPDQVLLSRSKITYLGQNTYRPKRASVRRKPGPSTSTKELQSVTTNTTRQPNSTKDLLRKPLPPRPVCAVCLVDAKPRDLLRPASSCKHERLICASCLGKYVVQTVMVEGLTKVVCPSMGCEAVLKYEEVIKYIEKDMECLGRFNDIITQRYTVYEWYPCPKCNEGQIHSKKSGPIITCDYCYEKSCFAHGEPWNECPICKRSTGKVLSQIEEKDEEEHVATDYKRCPNPTCGLPVGNVSGSNYMVCCCGHEFCWECLEDFVLILQKGRHLHDPDCSHYIKAGSIASSLELNIPQKNTPVTDLPGTLIPRMPYRTLERVPPPLNIQNRAGLTATAKTLTSKLRRLVLPIRG